MPASSSIVLRERYCVDFDLGVSTPKADHIKFSRSELKKATTIAEVGRLFWNLALNTNIWTDDDDPDFHLLIDHLLREMNRRAFQLSGRPLFTSHDSGLRTTSVLASVMSAMQDLSEGLNAQFNILKTDSTVNGKPVYDYTHGGSEVIFRSTKRSGTSGWELNLVNSYQGVDFSVLGPIAQNETNDPHLGAWTLNFDGTAPDFAWCPSSSGVPLAATYCFQGFGAGNGLYTDDHAEGDYGGKTQFLSGELGTGSGRRLRFNASSNWWEVYIPFYDVTEYHNGDADDPAHASWVVQNGDSPAGTVEDDPAGSCPADPEGSGGNSEAQSEIPSEVPEEGSGGGSF